MSKSSISLVQKHVSEELQQGATIDVYRLAKMIHGNCPDLTLEKVAEIVAESVVHGRGNAMWDRKAS